MNAGLEVRGGEALTHYWSEHKPTQPLWKLAWRLPKRREIELRLTQLYRSGLVHQGLHTLLWRHCTLMFIAGLLTVTRKWDQPTFPSADGWIRKLGHLYIVDYYSAIRKKLNYKICR